MGLQIQVLNASTSGEIDGAFQVLVRERPDAIFVSLDTLFADRRVNWSMGVAPRDPATYALRDFIEAGGLMSYGTNFFDAYRQVGLYTGRILKGAKPRTCRSYSRAVRAGHQPPDRRTSASPCRQRYSPSPTGDRIRAALLRLLTAAFGPTEIWQSRSQMSAVGGRPETCARSEPYGFDWLCENPASSETWRMIFL
jgi:hypothetical protein